MQNAGASTSVGNNFGDPGTLQSRLLCDIGLNDTEALLHFNLAPLHTRRDIAMLGVVHRAALGQGPPQLRRFFPMRSSSLMPGGLHGMQVVDVAAGFTQEYVLRSALGKARIYNALPQHIFNTNPNVAELQSLLQQILKSRAQSGYVLWPDVYR